MRHSQPDSSLLNSLHQSWMALLAGACLTVAVVFGVVAIPVLAADHNASPRQRMTFVELGTVVVDDNDRPVRGLHRKDFQVKEDGHEVKVTSFTEVPAAGVAGPGNGRSLVLLLDDTGVGPAATTIVQNIARRFLSRATPADAVAAVRLTHHDDEAVGSLQGALERVDEYMAKSLPYFGFETVQESLEALAKISTQLEPIEHRRKVVVCIGRRSLCDPYLEDPVDSLVWRQWRGALSATARANVSQYVVDPAGVTGRVDLGDGLVEHTGGADFVRSNNFERAVDQIWEEAGHYYLLGYAPTAHPRDLHSIHVTVKGKGLHVRARLDRGD